MRSVERDRLAASNSPDISPEDAFAAAIGVDVVTARQLVEDLTADLNRVSWGLRWMAPHPGTRRRILISDHLLMCVKGVQEALVEAKLHLLELEDVVEQESQRLRGALTITPDGRSRLDFPPSTAPIDMVPSKMLELHVAGCFRAIGSALDCLGGGIVGLLALPTNLLQASLRIARHELKKVPSHQSPGAQLRIAFRTDLDDAIAAAGPEGWLDWATDYRNMLVHRARRLNLVSLLPSGGGVLYGLDGSAYPSIRVTPQLARDPGRSDIEVFLGMTAQLFQARSAVRPVLEEPAELTLSELLDATLYVARTTCGRLQSVLAARRKDHVLLLQPKKQWPKVPSKEVLPFDGFAPGGAPFEPSTMTVNPFLGLRMAAASLLGEDLGNWTTFR